MFKRTLLILTLFIASVVNAKTLLIVGDSISAGFGIESGKGWVSLLERKLNENSYNYSIVNASISGDTTSNGLSRFPNLLETYKPSVVVIELGGNDGLRGISPKKIKQNIEYMISLAKQANAKVLLVGIQLPPNYGAQYLQRFMSVYTELATEQQVALLDSIVANTGGNPALMQADGIHPNTEGQAILLEDVWAQLKPLL